MTLSKFIEFASFGCAMDKYATYTEYEEIHDFTKPWHDLMDTQLDDLRLSVGSREQTLYGYDITDLAFIAALIQKEHISPTELRAILYDVARMSRIVIADITDTLQRAIENQMEDKL